ncbi:MAG: helix-hairpin-helix domain-containing protein, partial [Candidatus Caldarchaeum sp.]|nr:helix-hairpin-helix domain-containing protein [Candidatus Caldarchaeum sp.]MDW8436057.1 helix-hairpin-helix domain-containing protein [Candidatus Caldarchaeum sp.]
MSNIRYNEIEDLPGVSKLVAEKLRENGYSTVESIATATVAELVSLGLDEKHALEVISAAREGIEVSWVTAKDLAEIKTSIGRITTGSSRLDALIG